MKREIHLRLAELQGPSFSGIQTVKMEAYWLEADHPFSPRKFNDEVYCHAKIKIHKSYLLLAFKAKLFAT